jgi:hypothetical protein
MVFSRQAVFLKGHIALIGKLLNAFSGEKQQLKGGWSVNLKKER